ILVALLIALWIIENRFPIEIIRAPEVLFKDTTGRTLAMSDLRGKPVLVTFWATSCSICIREIPDLIRLYEEFAPEGFRLMAVAMFYDPPNRVVETARHWRFPYPVILDLKAELAHAFGSVSQIPASFLIGPDGSIAMHILGRIDPRKLRPVIRELLSKDSG
ncbi:MAG: TlpA family protein disulfide reductase, partial [Methylococcaceae bacterium]|nr:TlpA family protein disulfide reductase [Methylococcaceae bacterium]